MIVQRSAEKLNNRQGPVNEIFAIVDTDIKGNECIVQMMTCPVGCTHHLILTDLQVLDAFKLVFAAAINQGQRKLSLRRFVLVETVEANWTDKPH